MKRDDDQLDRYLTGETPIDRLPDELRVEEARLRDLLGTLEEEIRAPSTLRVAVVREIAEIPAPVWRRVLDWSFRPRMVRISPVTGALAVAASAALFFLWPGSPPAGDPSLAVDGAVQVVTRFVFVAPEASSVHITGDFVSWSQDGIELEDLRGTGIWTADIPLPPGIYQYTFVVNGTEWQADPRAVSQVDDGYGQVNSVVIVSAFPSAQGHKKSTGSRRGLGWSGYGSTAGSGTDFSLRRLGKTPPPIPIAGLKTNHRR